MSANIEHNPGGQDASPAAFDEAQLQRYLEGRLSAAEALALEAQLRTNPAARRCLDALREEERLLHDALEKRSEPSERLSDKVLTILHNEERFRIAAQRNRRLRRQVSLVVGIAASLLLCMWLVQPRASMGSAVSGTPASLLTAGGERRVLNIDTSVYEGDEITAMRGQFVRLRMADGTQVDIDERSKVGFEQGGAMRLISGRIGLDLGKTSKDFQVNLPQGSVRAAGGSRIDVWLPQPSGAQWPAALLPSLDDEPSTQSAERPAVVTVLKGVAVIVNEQSPSGVQLLAGQRSSFTPQSRSTRKVDLQAAGVETRSQTSSYHALKNVAPQDRLDQGMLESPEFVDLGRRLNMNAAGVPEALNILQAALQIPAVDARAEKLAAGQQALRVACETLKADDERRAFGRLLEGLAHLERGRTLYRTNATAAGEAFHAARVAFEEALNNRAGVADSTPAWVPQLNDSGNALLLPNLSAADQCAAIASYQHAVALLWSARVMATQEGTPEMAAREFDSLAAAFGRSADAMAARLGQGLALKTKGSRKDAAQAFDEVVSMSLAGTSDRSREIGEGLKQAALVAQADMYLAAHEADAAQQAADELRILYPLENSGAAGREIRRLLQQSILKDATAALQSRHYDAAILLFDDYLASAPPAPVDARLKLLEALVAAGNSERAYREAGELAPLVPAEKKGPFEALRKKAEAMPRSEARPEPAILQPRH